MVELKEQEDGRVALIMDQAELPSAVEALLRVGYGLTPPDGAQAEQGEDSQAEPEEPQAEAEEAGEDLSAEEPDDDEAQADEPEDLDAEEEEPRRRSRRGRRE
jgi:hypothetical protein